MIHGIKRFFSWVFSLKRIRRRAEATKLPPQVNRRLIGQRLFYVTLVVFAVFVLRLSWLTVTHDVAGTNIVQMAKANVTYTAVQYPKRGTIYDRMGQPIAVDSSTFAIYVTLDKSYVDAAGNSLYADPKSFPDLVQFLNKELGIPTGLAESQLTRKGAMQVQFGTNGTNISYSKRAQIIQDAAKQGLKGIGFVSHLARSYPNGKFASNLIGLASLKNPGDDTSGLVGVNGLEASFDSILSGQKGEITTEKDMYGRAIPGATLSEKKAVDGQDVYTTLDSDLQTQLEQSLDTLQTQTGAQQISAALVEAKTGDVLATSQRPTFNPQDMSGTKDPGFTWNNLMFQAIYEPGSTMKTFLVSAAMDTGNWHPNEAYVRSLNVYGVTINDWDMNEHGYYTAPSSMTFADGFAFSSNTGMSKVEIGMGYPTWSKYLNRFMFGLPTRMGFGGELGGSLPGSNQVTQIMSAFGQGIAVTQAQMLRGWTAIANNGTMLEPHLVSKIVNPNNQTVLQSAPEVIGQPITAQTANQMLPLMETVNTNSNYGTANNLIAGNGQNGDPMFVVNGQPAAVKTGTAQVADPNTGGYLEGPNQTLNSAVVMYPVSNPDFIFYIYIKLPKSYKLSFVSDLTNSLLTRAESLKTQLDNTKFALKDGQITIENYYGQTAGPVEDTMRQTLLQPVLIGDGNKITDQSIQSGTKVYANQKILLLTDGAHTMPDMQGWNKTDVEQLAKWYGLKVTYSGKSGSVSKQSLEFDTPVKSGDKLTVTLSG